jgi:hypothetical protein
MDNVDKEAMGHFLPCICPTEAGIMPAIAILKINPDNTRDLVMKNIRTNFKTSQPKEAYNQAEEDYKSILATCSPIDDGDQRGRCMMTRLREKGYIETNRNIKTLVRTTLSSDVIH